MQNHLKELYSSSYQEIYKFLDTQIKELSEIKFMLSIHECCETLLSIVPEKFMGEEISINIERDRDESMYNYFYFNYRGESNRLFDEFSNSSGNQLALSRKLVDHFDRFFDNEDSNMLYERLNCAFIFQEKSVEELKKIMMGQDLYKKYCAQKLDMKISSNCEVHNEQIKKPKI